MAQLRSEGLNAPIDSTNKGFQLLKVGKLLPGWHFRSLLLSSDALMLSIEPIS